MEVAYFEKGCWSYVVQMIRCLSEGLRSDDKDMKHLCLVVLAHHLDALQKEAELLPSDLTVAHDSKVTLQQLVQRFQTPLSS